MTYWKVCRRAPYEDTYYSAVADTVYTRMTYHIGDWAYPLYPDMPAMIFETYEDAGNFVLEQIDGIDLYILPCEARDVRPIERIPRLIYLWLGIEDAIEQWKLCLEGRALDFSTVEVYPGTMVCSAVKLLPDSDVGRTGQTGQE
jgi:hypothetical protein